MSKLLKWNIFQDNENNFANNFYYYCLFHNSIKNMGREYISDKMTPSNNFNSKLKV